MNNRISGLTLAYHGCDRSVGELVLAGKTELVASRNSYDWLGHGIYFWEYNAKRAIYFARSMELAHRKGKTKIKEPMVIGAVIDLGVCLNLLDSNRIDELSGAYANLVKLYQNIERPLPVNRTFRGSTDLLMRHLDCAVIELLHQMRADENKPAFDSARGVFVEGKPIYPGAAIHQYNHIQICVRNPACIRGYFRVRDE